MIRYTLSFPRPASHLFQVAVQVDDAQGPYIDAVMPAWIPGSYKIRDFARLVQDFEAGSMEWKKIDKNTWRVFHRGARRVEFRYRVYAYELTVRSSHLDETHAYINAPSVLMYIDGKRGEPVSVAIRKPAGWKIACALGEAIKAPNYDVLADSPIEVGRFWRGRFQVAGRAHEFVVHGEGNCEPNKLIRDTRKIIRAASRIFGEIPYSRYLFLLHTTQVASGGLEHAHSCSLQTGMFDFKPAERYQRVLNLVAHEYFHLWNVKRIIPANLIPYDYRREMYTGLLWLAEGVTSYYASLILARAGLVRPKEFFKETAKMIRAYRDKPGRLVQSLAESSYDAWIKQYQPHEHSINASISYYEKGQLVGMMLDLELRRRTRNRVTLDDVMRTLFEEFAKRGRGVGEGDVKEVVERLARRSFDGFFGDYVYGVRELDLERALRQAGLELRRKPDGKPAKAYLGVVTQKQPEKIVIVNVLDGSPAQRDGLSAGDEVMAVDGFKVSPELWEKRLEEKEAGDALTLTVFRGGLLRSVEVALGGRTEHEYEVRPTAKPNALQREIASDWLGVPWKAIRP